MLDLAVAMIVSYLRRRCPWRGSQGTPPRPVIFSVDIEHLILWWTPPAQDLQYSERVYTEVFDKYD